MGEAKELAVRFLARPIYAIKRSVYRNHVERCVVDVPSLLHIFGEKRKGEAKGRGSKSSGSLGRQRTSTPGGHDLWRGRLITMRPARIRKQISQILIQLSRLMAARLRRRCREGRWFITSAIRGSDATRRRLCRRPRDRDYRCADISDTSYPPRRRKKSTRGYTRRNPAYV